MKDTVVLDMKCAERCAMSLDSKLPPEHWGKPIRFPYVAPIEDVRHPNNACRYCGASIEFATEPLAAYEATP